MTKNPILKTLRAKKLGTLIRDARQKTGKSVEECSQAIGMTGEDFNAIERGEKSPALPELEILAYFLELPLDHFWGNQLLNINGKDRAFDLAGIKQLRQNAIGSLIRKARLEADYSPEELSKKTGISEDVLSSYEKGEVAVPITELEAVVEVLNNSIANFEDTESQVGSWFTEQRNAQEFLSLPKELQEFIGKPVNRPYLELAIKLSELKVERLRTLAESLLEITL